jgi:hypothetical protein
MMMRKNLLCLVFALAAFGVAASTATAGELSVKIANGRATIIAKDVPVRQILAEWAKVGETKILNGEKVAGGPVTLELSRRSREGSARRPAADRRRATSPAPRPANLAGASQFDRVIVLATSRAPAATTSLTPPPFGNRAACRCRLPRSCRRTTIRRTRRSGSECTAHHGPEWTRCRPFRAPRTDRSSDRTARSSARAA